MSVHVTSAVWKHPIENPGAKLVLLAISDIANHDGTAWPSAGTIAEMTGLGQSTVRAHIKSLQDAGLLEVQQRTAAGGRQTSNLFRILIGQNAGCQNSAPPPEPARIQHPTLQISAGEVPEFSTSTLQISAPLNRTEEPPKEPSKEPPAGSFQLQNGKQAKSEQIKLDIPDTLPDFPAASMMRFWNTHVPSLPTINGIAGKRESAARARWKDLGGKIDRWIQFCDRVEKSDFLTGRTKGGRSFTASFDWCMNPGNFLKITEGKYDNKAEPPKPNAKRFF